MYIFATVVFVVAVVAALATMVTLWRHGRYMLPILVFCALALLSAFAVYVLSGADPGLVVFSSSPVYFVYALAFLCLFVVIYPAVSSKLWRERLRIYFLLVTVGVMLYLANPILFRLALPAPLISLAYVTAMILVYTIGAMVGSSHSRKHYKKRCRVSYGVWGASAVSHLLVYLAIGLLFAVPKLCASGLAELILCSFSMILACTAAVGVTLEGDYWTDCGHEPKGVADGAKYFGAAVFGESKRRHKKHRST